MSEWINVMEVISWNQLQIYPWYIMVSTCTNTPVRLSPPNCYHGLYVFHSWSKLWLLVSQNQLCKKVTSSAETIFADTEFNVGCIMVWFHFTKLVYKRQMSQICLLYLKGWMRMNECNANFPLDKPGVRSPTLEQPEQLGASGGLGCWDPW